MNEEHSEEEPKLIIDEDWKTQVQKEKQQLQQQKNEDASPEESEGEPNPEATTANEDEVADSAPPETETPSTTPEENAEPAPPPPPPATMTFLITSLATQAMAALGQLPGEDGQPLPVNKDYARHFIDLLSILEEKTKGNLDTQEEKFLSETLHQMRMMFVSQTS